MILILGGTKDSRDLLNSLKELNKEVIITTATKYGGELIDIDPNTLVVSKRLDQEELKELCLTNNVDLVIDTTHPYASIISQNAMAICEVLNITYLRFERPLSNYHNVHVVKDYEELLEELPKTEGNILLTTGSNNIDKFIKLKETRRVYIRVLPTKDVLDKCESLGYNAKDIIAMQGPFSEEFNRVLYKDLNIKVLVTKDSGKTGGTLEKIVPALEQDIKVFLVDRPSITYKNIYNTLEDLIQRIKEN